MTPQLILATIALATALIGLSRLLPIDCLTLIILTSLFIAY